jgi:hypothetical protein
MTNYPLSHSGGTINSALGKIITPDTAPTLSSDKFVTSDGILTALNSIKVGQLGFRYTLTIPYQTLVTLNPTDDEDGPNGGGFCMGHMLPSSNNPTYPQHDLSFFAYMDFGTTPHMDDSDNSSLAWIYRGTKIAENVGESHSVPTTQTASTLGSFEADKVNIMLGGNTNELYFYNDYDNGSQATYTLNLTIFR